MKKLISLMIALLGATGAFAQSPLSEGEVRKIDKEQGKVTIKHGEIKNLDMPPMTMVFRAQPPALVDKVQVGDKVRFQAEKVNGTYTVTALERAQ
ncbi:copper-binding protein [Caldimonas tepidiphila]|uniref:copper-binding protein n=1 Tax=Caldimonas tepidiphila TaxID=2315841 RepID=UPI000E5BDB14|nr:copper-binding protein [Caldimonas tepidiphila]